MIINRNYNFFSDKKLIHEKQTIGCLLYNIGCIVYWHYEAINWVFSKANNWMNHVSDFL